MPSFALNELRSAGSTGLSSLPQRSECFGPIVSYGGSETLSRSTSAGSSLSDGRAHQETTLLDSRKTISKPLSLDEYFEERQSIQTLKKFYEEKVVVRKGVNSDTALSRPLSLEEYYDKHENVHHVQPLKKHHQDNKSLKASAPTFRPGKQAFGDTLNINAKPFVVGKKPLNAYATSFTPSEQTFGESNFNIDAQALDMCSQAITAPGQEFDHWQHEGVESFDVTRQTFEIGDLSFDAGWQTFNANAPCFQPQATGDHAVTTTNSEAWGKVTCVANSQPRITNSQPRVTCVY